MGLQGLRIVHESFMLPQLQRSAIAPPGRPGWLRDDEASAGGFEDFGAQVGGAGSRNEWFTTQ